MVFNLAVVLVVAGLGTAWILASPLLRAIVLDTLRHPNRGAVFEVDGGVVTVTPKSERAVGKTNGERAVNKTNGVSYVEAAGILVMLSEESIVPANWPRLLARASYEPQRSTRQLQQVG